jgi:hypothetical protein
VRLQKNLPAPAPNRHLIATASKKRPEFSLAAVRTNATRAWWSTSSDPGFVGAKKSNSLGLRLSLSNMALVTFLKRMNAG